MRFASQHVLSVSRILLGAVVLTELVEVYSSRLVLTAVVAACLADYADGKVARASGTAGDGGRLVDNLCDASFLALAFAGFALAGTWSLPLIGTATRIWRHANWLPVLALAGSFGTYMVRWAASRRLGRAPVRSPAGHTAGIANYALALVGGVAVLPGVKLPPALLETALFLIVLLNLRAVVENLQLMRSLRHGSAA